MSTKEILKTSQLEILESKILEINNKEQKIQKEENNNYSYGLNNINIKIKNKIYEKWYNENYSK